MSESFRVGEIGQIAITVSDVARGLSFYRDVLGLEFLFDAGANLAFLRAGQTRVMLTTPQGAGAVGANSVLYFRVQNLADSYDAFVRRGGAGDRPAQLAAKLADHELWLAFLRDPDGNLVGLMEERPITSEGAS